MLSHTLLRNHEGIASFLVGVSVAVTLVPLYYAHLLAAWISFERWLHGRRQYRPVRGRGLREDD